MGRPRVLIPTPTSRSVRGPDRETLAPEGFGVTTAADGLECVAKLRSLGPGVLVMRPE